MRKVEEIKGRKQVRESFNEKGERERDGQEIIKGKMRSRRVRVVKRDERSREEWEGSCFPVFPVKL
jgi:hypothetical protein